jgi:pyrroline-5-carboxylate reductase
MLALTSPVKILNFVFEEDAMEGNVGFIGAGNMGEALIKGMLSGNVAEAERITAYDVVKDRLKYIEQTYGVNTSSDAAETVGRSTTLVLAVKPQIVPLVLKNFSPFIRPEHLIISICAGTTLDTLEGGLPENTRVIRVMPNTPALIGSGAAALCKGAKATDDDLAAAREIFEAVGVSVVVEEKVMDAVTGLSGSGPAYVFQFIEALSDGGVKMGLSRDVATKLAVQTVIGSARMVAETGKHPAVLKEMVTSPGGTTIAGVHALEQGGLRGIVMDAVEAATLRSEELGKGK